MRITIYICISLALTSPQFVSADKQKSGGGGKAAAHPGGGGGGSRAAAHPSGGFPHAGAGAPHAGGSGMSNHAGMSQHNLGNNNAQSGGHAAHTQHGLNTNQQSAQHGLNSHQGAQHGLNSHQGTHQALNAHTGSGLQAHHAGKLSPTHPINNHLAAHNRAAPHWRSGLRYRNTHALYAGYHRVWHDRGYWRSHYSDVVYVGGPYWGSNWYWDGGYWFPAWGYDPGFVGYAYDGPIFAYNNLPPDEVVINIQEALQDQGYYTGNIDGQFGNQTRDALAAYQRDHELEVTAAIDEPTVQSLGLVTEQS
jgi:hypothetical protein